MRPPGPLDWSEEEKTSECRRRNPRNLAGVCDRCIHACGICGDCRLYCSHGLGLPMAPGVAERHQRRGRSRAAGA